MKKILSWALALCILLTACGTGFMFITASAVQSIDGSEVTWSFDNLTKTLTFGGKGDIPDYDDTYKDDSGTPTTPWGGIDYSNLVFGEEITGIGNFAFYKSLSLESITIPENITKIGKGAFLQCAGLKSITIQGNVSKIDSQTFSACTALKSVSLPSTVEEIGDSAFYKCSSLVSIALPDAVKAIGESTFNSCILLSSFNAPASLESIGNRAFYCCEALKTLTLNEKLTAIGVSAFDGCSKLEAVSIPSEVKTISEAAFSSCTKLASVELADGIETIEKEAFNLCTSLKAVTVPHTVETIGAKAIGYGKRSALIDGFVITGYADTAAQTYAEANEITFNSLGKYIPKSGSISETLTWELSDDGVLTFTGSGEIPECKPDETPEYMLGNPQTIILSDGITSVGANAFLGSYTEISIPETITSIGDSAFGFYIDENGEAAKTENFTVYGYRNSAAKTYATENGFTFIKLDVGEPDLTFKISENAEICTLDEESKIITVYNSNTSFEKLLADFIIGEDITVEPIEKVATSNVIVLKNGDEEIASYKIIVIGDVNRDGKINSADALIILQNAVGLISLEGDRSSAGDINKDGSINSFDALSVLQISVGQISPVSFMPKVEIPTQPDDSDKESTDGNDGSSESEAPSDGENIDEA